MWNHLDIKEKNLKMQNLGNPHFQLSLSIQQKHAKSFKIKVFKKYLKPKQRKIYLNLNQCKSILSKMNLKLTKLKLFETICILLRTERCYEDFVC